MINSNISCLFEDDVHRDGDTATWLWNIYNTTLQRPQWKLKAYYTRYYKNVQIYISFFEKLSLWRLLLWWQISDLKCIRFPPVSSQSLSGKSWQICEKKRKAEWWNKHLGKKKKKKNRCCQESSFLPFADVLDSLVYSRNCPFFCWVHLNYNTQRRGKGEIFPALLGLADCKIDSAGDEHENAKYVESNWLMFYWRLSCKDNILTLGYSFVHLCMHDLPDHIGIAQ